MGRFSSTHSSERLKRIGLGSVQFGMDYGVSNKGGQTSVDEAKLIIQSAADSGVRIIDTAASYGNSEEILGEILQSEYKFDIVTKTIPCRSERISEADCAIIKSTFIDSLQKLNTDSVYGLLIHDARELECDCGDKLFETLLEIKNSGQVQKIGLSVYNGAQIDNALERYPIDIIQLPINILDQRLLRSGHLAMLRERGVEIHVRSTFLQGLLLMDPETLPDKFSTVQSHLIDLRKTLTKLEVSPLEAALDFVLGIKEIDCVVTGVESEVQLQQIFEAATRQLPEVIDYAKWAWHDQAILDPSNWSKLDQDKNIAETLTNQAVTT